MDHRSIIDCKEITKKDINDFLNKKMAKDLGGKSSIQKILAGEGIGGLCRNYRSYLTIIAESS